jgi:hypothetical protein
LRRPWRNAVVIGAKEYLKIVAIYCFCLYNTYCCKSGKRHITGLYTLRRLKAARVPQNTSRATLFVVFCSTTFLGLQKLLRSFFIATPETSYTTFTLCAIGFEDVKKSYIFSEK